ncbi:MAG: 3-hydroxyacyl-CoA dehydrogenase [Hydrogenophaga sp.]|nr:3-hydroxyacyl-CoA dehydrogenase [Hydrogenophaga sp.]
MNVTWENDADGVALLRTPAGAFGPEALAALERAVKACLADDAVNGIVIAPGDGRFLGELDLHWLSRAGENEPVVLEAFARRSLALASSLEAAAKPVAAALTGDAHGVGLELALACHRRFGARSAGYSVGFTDGRYGLAPLFGTALRLATRVGREAALRLLRDATALTPTAAHKAGLIDELWPAEGVIDEARRWVVLEAAQRAQRPADRANAAAVMGTQDAAAAFAEVARSGVACDMVRTLGLSVADANRLASRPVGVPTRSFARVGVLGAGLMGSGIALVAARAGMDVVLVDRTLEAARRGLEALEKQEATGVAAGRLDAQVSQAALARITPTDQYGDLSGVDIVVEAVFEDRAVKAEATRLAEEAAGPSALFATNTSTLPITGLAEASVRPEDFIGLHFFSPVPRMPLLEIIRGQRTSAETLAHAMDFARAIGKTPIVVNDARGFYTTRVVMAYQAEAFDMLAQGCDPAVIEAGGVAAGMPVPPLALSDAVALDLIHQINLQAAHDLGDAYAFTPGYAMVGRMVEQASRKGKKNARGFYDYGDNGSRHLWDGLRAFAAGSQRTAMSVADARDRLLAAQALETVRCLDEGVITDPSQCDVGAILGWGFSPWTGGPLSWIDRMGVASCVARCESLARRYESSRLQPPAGLRKLAASGTSIYAARWPLE